MKAIRLLFIALVFFAVSCKDFVSDLPTNIPGEMGTPIIGPIESPTPGVTPPAEVTLVATISPTSIPTEVAAPTPTKLSGKPYTGPCKEVRRFSSNWRVDHYLYKPIAEHVGKPVVIFQLQQKLLVQFLDKNKKKILTLPFRSYGSAGFAYQDEVSTGTTLKKKYGSIWVHAVDTTSCTDYFQADPTKRSDGLNK